MTGTNCSNDRLVLRQNVEINSNEYFSCDVFFREWNRPPRGLGTSLRNHQEKRLWVISTIYYGLSNDSRKKFLCSRVPLFSLGLKAPRSPCSHSGRLSEVVLTHYRRREVRNSIYRYWKIHIDYRSKFSYRFISSISIIYGNTSIISQQTFLIYLEQ